MNKIDVVLQVAWSYHGTPYIWGGDNPQGFDCSGLVVECLKSVGVLPRKGDWTADGLFVLFKNNEIVSEEQVAPGDLVFWSNEQGKYIHVEIVIGQGLSIGASGGGSWAVDPKVALARGAFIKVRPYTTRGGAYRFLRPPYS